MHLDDGRVLALVADHLGQNLIHPVLAVGPAGGEEAALGGVERDEYHVVLVVEAGAALLFHQADDAEVDVVDADRLPDGLAAVGEELIVDALP